MAEHRSGGWGIQKRIVRWASALRRDVAAVYLSLRDPRTPWYARWLGVAVVAYAFSPIDLVPDFVPVLGYLDDLLIVPAGVWLVLRWIPPDVLADARAHIDAQLREPKPVSAAGAVAVVAVWLALGALVAWAVYRRAC